MQRLEGWEQRYIRFTTLSLRTAWGWGSHDCAIFAANCIREVTSEDLAAEYRGQYDNEAEAWRFLARLGYEDLGQLASARLPEIKPRDARRCDIVLMPGELGEFLGVVDGRTVIGPVAPRGIAHSPIDLAKRAWRVG